MISPNFLFHSLLLWGVFLSLIASIGFAEEQLPYLHSVRIENKIPDTKPSGIFTTISLFTKKPELLKQQFQGIQAGVFEHHIVMEYADYVPTPIKGGERYQKESFLIDYKDIAFQKIETNILKSVGQSPSVEELSTYTFQLLTKTMDRLYDVASIVALQKQGDCSEHAVFLTAILRNFNIPAKVVHGIVLRFFPERNQWRGFGHAWVEYYRNDSWQGIDPTFNQKVDNSYIPNFAVEDEGMSLSYYILNQEASIGVEKVILH